ncbi:MAG: hypothetical protein ACYC0Q_05865 [Eubacteriales bacterium]
MLRIDYHAAVAAPAEYEKAFIVFGVAPFCLTTPVRRVGVLAVPGVILRTGLQPVPLGLDKILFSG